MDKVLIRVFRVIPSRGSVPAFCLQLTGDSRHGASRGSGETGSRLGARRHAGTQTRAEDDRQIRSPILNDHTLNRPLSLTLRGW